MVSKRLGKFHHQTSVAQIHLYVGMDPLQSSKKHQVSKIWECLANIRHNLFSRTVFTICGRQFKPKPCCCHNSYSENFNLRHILTKTDVSTARTHLLTSMNTSKMSVSKTVCRSMERMSNCFYIPRPKTLDSKQYQQLARGKKQAQKGLRL